MKTRNTADSAHTDGPWVRCGNFVDSRDGHGRLTGLNDNNSICEAYGPDSKANALLIAAAPDLLLALEELICIGHGVGCQSRNGGDCDCWMYKAVNAIAKAKGGAQ